MVELVDVRPYRPVVQLPRTPITSLPETLESGILARLGSYEFEVVEALPSTREQIADIGHLRLIVRYASVEGEEDIEAAHVYNTVSGKLPPFEAGTSKLDRASYQLTEGDWRQVEFVSRTLSAEIEQTMAGVRSIIENHQVDGGYDACYGRDLILGPMASEAITYDELTTLFAEGREDRDGLSVLGHANVIEGGFAFRTASLTEVYGYQINGIVQALCLGGVGTYEYDSPELQSTADFCADHNLCLIDWMSAMKLDPETEEFFAFFDPPANLDEVYQEAPL